MWRDLFPGTLILYDEIFFCDPDLRTALLFLLFDEELEMCTEEDDLFCAVAVDTLFVLMSL